MIRVLSDEDFELIHTQSGRLVGCKTPGYLLVLFYSNKSHACKSVFRAISQLDVDTCTVSVMSVHRDSRVVEMSKNTQTELTRVPSVIMYVDGHPKAIYHSSQDSEPSTDDYRRFILLIMQKFKSSGKPFVGSGEAGRSSSNSNNQTSVGKNATSRPIPAYSIGVPICNDDVCYLPISEAYQS